MNLGIKAIFILTFLSISGKVMMDFLPALGGLLNPQSGFSGTAAGGPKDINALYDQATLGTRDDLEGAIDAQKEAQRNAEGYDPEAARAAQQWALENPDKALMNAQKDFHGKMEAKAQKVQDVAGKMGGLMGSLGAPTQAQEEETPSESEDRAPADF